MNDYPFNRVNFYIDKEINIFSYEKIEKYKESIEVLIEKTIEKFLLIKSDKCYLSLKKNEINNEKFYTMVINNNYFSYSFQNFTNLNSFFTYLLSINLVMRNTDLQGFYGFFIQFFLKNGGNENENFNKTIFNSIKKNYKIDVIKNVSFFLLLKIKNLIISKRLVYY